jgi:hypothetical protein
MDRFVTRKRDSENVKIILTKKKEQAGPSQVRFLKIGALLQEFQFCIIILVCREHQKVPNH